MISDSHQPGKNYLIFSNSFESGTASRVLGGIDYQLSISCFSPKGSEMMLLSASIADVMYIWHGKQLSEMFASPMTTPVHQALYRSQHTHILRDGT